MARTCDQCHRKMSPFVPRKKNDDGDFLCEGCRNGREGRPLSRSADVNDEYVQSVKDMSDVEFDEFMRSLKGHGVEQGRIDNMYETRRTSQLIRAQTPDAGGRLIVMAHGNQDGITVFHCPFCGSGQVINSGTSINCDFCHSTFTVLVQPQFPMMPQTVDGQPYTPGQQPGNDPTTPAPAQAPGGEEDDDGSFGGDQLSEKLPTDDDDTADAAGGDDSGNPFAKKDDSDKPPAPKKSALAAYITEEGVVLSEDEYMSHLAIKFSPHRDETLAEVKQLHGRF